MTLERKTVGHEMRVVVNYLGRRGLSSVLLGILRGLWIRRHSVTVMRHTVESPVDMKWSRPIVKPPSATSTAWLTQANIKTLLHSLLIFLLSLLLFLHPLILLIMERSLQELYTPHTRRS